MAEQSSNNIFRYTGLTYEDLKNKIDTIILGDDRLKNFSDSALYKVIMNTFIGAADLVNYYIERTSEEMFLDTAKHQSSVILNASQIGYVVRRPVPATANFRFVLKGPITGISQGQQLSIPAYSVVKYGATDFIVKYTYTYTFTNDDVINLSVPGSTKTFTVADVGTTEYPLELIQGTITTTEIIPQSQAGKKFQKYTIDDPTFSNLYGTEDLGGGVISDDPQNNTRNITRVIIKENGKDDIELHINRRSLTSDPYVIAQVREQSQNEDNANINPIKACLVKTNYDTTVKLIFGDGLSTSLGPTSNQTVSIQYLSTIGEAANVVGVRGQPLSYDGTITINSIPISSNNYSFFLESNITGGADLEDTESIRINAPAIFQSLDRLVTRTDYKYYLSTLTTPIVVKHSVVWGEAEEARARKIGAYQNLFNVAVLCAFGSLYKSVQGNLIPRKVLTATTEYYDENDLDEILIGTGDTKANDESTYCELFVQGRLTDLMEYQYSNTGDASELSLFLESIKEKSQATVKNIYIPPIFQGFNLTGTVYMKPFADAEQTGADVKQEIRKYLELKNDLETPIYLSDVVGVIKNNTNVNYCNIAFEPIDIDPGAQTYENMAALIEPYINGSPTVKSAVVTSAYDLFNEYLLSKSNDINVSDGISITFGYTSSATPSSAESTSSLYNKSIVRLGDITERSLYDEFAASFFAACKSATIETTGGVEYCTSDFFTDFIKAGTNTLKLAIRNSMLDEHGNISNYSLPNEIAVIYDDQINFAYGGNT